MAETITPRETMEKDMDDMKVRMELMIMGIQVNQNSGEIRVSVFFYGVHLSGLY
jgi:hypothetical protein